MNVLDLREFYLSPLGRMARDVLRGWVARLWGLGAGKGGGEAGILLALGYGTPLLRPWLGKAERLLAMMPREQGVAYWPPEGENICCFADLQNLPLPDESVDRVLVMHALETASEPQEVLREVWRVLKNNGRAILIAPNRRGFWAHHDENPFGNGRPFSGTQLKALVREQGFSVARCARCLYMPPWRGALFLALAPKIEKIARLLFGKFGGVLVLEVEKQIVFPVLAKSRKTAPSILLPLSWPVSSGPVATRDQP